MNTREVVLDGLKMKTVRETHLYLKKMLNLSSSYGENLDALWDELSTRISPLSIKVINDYAIKDQLDDYGDKLISLFLDICLSNEAIQIKYENPVEERGRLMNATIKMMLGHRSIRKFEKRSIEPSDLNLIVDAARAASTSSFLQAYSIISVKDMEKRAQITKLCGDQEYVEQAAVFLVFCADLYRLKKVCEFNHTPYESGWTESFIIATVDASIAAQNAMVAAESLGLGGVYIGGIRNNSQEVSEMLNLPEEVYPVFGMCLGYPAQDPEVKTRMPRDVMFFEDSYKPIDENSLSEYDAYISTYYSNRTKGKNNDTWSASVSKKFEKETRPHMKQFLNERKFNIK